MRPAGDDLHHQAAIQKEVNVMSGNTSEPLTVFVRDRATWLAYFLSLFYAYVLNVLGPLTPFLRAELGLDYTVASLHFSAFAVGMLLAGATADRVVARLGQRATLWAGAFGLAGGMLLLTVGRQPAVTIAACLAMGAVGSWILAVYPAVLAQRHGSQRAIALTEAVILGSIGAAAAPFLLGLMARTPAGWRAALLLPVVALIPLFLAFRTESLSRASAQQARPAGRANHQMPRLPAGYWAYWALLVAVVAIEFCIVFWVADFLQSTRSLAAADAAMAVTIFLTAMVVGRIVISRLLRQFQPFTLLLASLVVALGGFLALWLVQPVTAAVTGLAIAGLGVANLYPISLSLAVGAAPHAVEQASARASLASGVAILALPLLLGWAADSVGIAAAFGVIGVLIVLAVILLLVVKGVFADDEVAMVESRR